MTNWKYTDQSNNSVVRISEDGRMESRLVEEIADWISEGNTPEPADPAPVTSYTALREAAYKTESDTLFFQEQRGEVPAGTWAAKVAEIKLRIPKP